MLENRQGFILCKKEDGTKISEHFAIKEFSCKCDENCESWVSKILMDRVQALRNELRQPLKINSCFRCEKHNALIGGKPKSKHLLGIAVDLAKPVGMGIEEFRLLCSEKFKYILLYENFIHCDLRGDIQYNILSKNIRMQK